MSENVIPFPGRKQPSTAPLVWDGIRCDACGGAWLLVEILVRHDGTVASNALTGVCKDCREPVELPIPPL